MKSRQKSTEDYTNNTNIGTTNSIATNAHNVTNILTNSNTNDPTNNSRTTPPPIPTTKPRIVNTKSNNISKTNNINNKNDINNITSNSNISHSPSKTSSKILNSEIQQDPASCRLGNSIPPASYNPLETPKFGITPSFVSPVGHLGTSPIRPVLPVRSCVGALSSMGNHGSPTGFTGAPPIPPRDSSTYANLGSVTS